MARSGARTRPCSTYLAERWNNSSGSVALPVHASQFSAPLNAGNAYAAVILSTPVINSDNDGILDAWKAGPAAGDFFAGQPGYYDVKTGSWVPLPGALHGQKDLFVQLDYMCGAVLSDGSCDPGQENLFPSPDAKGNDPLAMVTNAFAAIGVHLHLEIGNAVPERHLHGQHFHYSAATVPVPERAGSDPAGRDRLEKQPGILEAVAAQSCFLRGGRRLQSSFPIWPEG